MTTIIKEPPITLDWSMKKGQDFHRTILLREDDGVTVINTTGYSMTLTIKSAPNGETYATVTATNSPANGQFNLDITAAVIDGYTFSNAVYEVQLVDSSGGKTIPYMGNLTLIP